ncbi:hypothetical protein [uncultured Kriegella sp.]|uniref:hypothetical protein n=1 Tax=uncultured Kriegella sp. TaxID=1798910 RepID=UPI0030DD52A1
MARDLWSEDNSYFMGRSKRSWLWNILIVVTIIVCLVAFVAHYKNWTKVSAKDIQILSGAYYRQIQFADLDSVLLVEKIPPMERLNGFSAMAKEKGLFREFKDSLTDKKVYVYLDNFDQQKIKIVYKDSLKLFLNLSDSLETDQLYRFLLDKKDATTALSIKK